MWKKIYNIFFSNLIRLLTTWHSICFQSYFLNVPTFHTAHAKTFKLSCSKKNPQKTPLCSFHNSSCFTFKKRTYFLPACYAPLFGVLSQWGLQEEQGNATGEQEQHVRNEEHTLREKKNKQTNSVFQLDHKTLSQAQRVPDIKRERGF